MDQHRTDDDLTAEEWSRFQGQDPEIFKRVYQRYVGLVQYVADRFRFSVQARDELVQEVFLRLYKNTHTIEKPTAIAAWLAVATRRCAIDLLRKDSRLVFRDAAEWEQKSPTTDVDENKLRNHLDINALADIVAEAVSPQDSRTFRAFYADGKKAREIAAEEGVAVATITARLSRMRTRCRQLLVKHIEKLDSG